MAKKIIVKKDDKILAKTAIKNAHTSPRVKSIAKKILKKSK